MHLAQEIHKPQKVIGWDSTQESTLHATLLMLLLLLLGWVIAKEKGGITLETPLVWYSTTTLMFLCN